MADPIKVSAAEGQPGVCRQPYFPLGRFLGAVVVDLVANLPNILIDGHDSQTSYVLDDFRYERQAHKRCVEQIANPSLVLQSPNDDR